MPIKVRKVGGETERRTRLTRIGNKYNVEFVYNNILWSLQSSPQIVFETPALELLHAAVAPIDEQYAKQLVQNATTLEEARNAVRRAKLLNEYVVHGIGRYWFKTVNNAWSLGYDMDKPKQQGQVSSWWLDPNVDRMEIYIAKAGLAAVIKMYHNYPERLVKEATLNIR
ncbi:hypothetical protein HYW19_02620 [Candidatus Woesearchaeota archaeon]|nr:hypothetical protein [Candidatus Woesearchaeota archaeon]